MRLNKQFGWCAAQLEGVGMTSCDGLHVLGVGAGSETLVLVEAVRRRAGYALDGTLRIGHHGRPVLEASDGGRFFTSERMLEKRARSSRKFHDGVFFWKGHVVP